MRGLEQTTKEVKIPEGSSVVIVNSNKKHQLAGLDSEYNQRRAQCEEVSPVCELSAPSPTLSPTDPVPRGLLTLCPAWHAQSLHLQQRAATLRHDSRAGAPRLHHRLLTLCRAP